jgi:hypothetical protein
MQHARDGRYGLLQEGSPVRYRAQVIADVHLGCRLNT